MLPVKAFGSIGGVKPSIRFRVAGSNGFVVAMSGAQTAESTRMLTTVNEMIATGERLKA